MNQRNWAFFIAPQTQTVCYAKGSPGTCKSASVAALAKAAGRRYIQLCLDQLMPEDIGGVPCPQDIDIDGHTHRGVVRLLDESMLRARLEKTVVLLDELNQISHTMMAATQEAWLNPPPENAWVFAAGNPLDQASNGVEFTPPFVNRICVVEWEVPLDDVRAGWQTGFRNYPAPDVPIVPADYLDNFEAYWANLLAEFSTHHPELFPDTIEAAGKLIELANGGPFPSVRSWTNVGKLMCAADSVGANSGVKHALIHGCVGEAAGSQFQRWLTEQQLPDPEELLAMPHKLKMGQRFDMNRAILASVLGRLRAENSPVRWEAGYDLLERAFSQQPELAMSAEGALFKLKPEGHTPKIRNGSAAEMRKLRLATA